MGVDNARENRGDRETFVAWAAIGIRHEAIRLAKKESIRKRREALILDAPAPPNQDGAQGSRIIDGIAASDNIEEEVLGRVTIEEALDMLTPAQKQVIKAVIIRGLPERKVAEALRISQPTVNRLKQAALRRLRPCFAKGGSPCGECTKVL